MSEQQQHFDSLLATLREITDPYWREHLAKSVLGRGAAEILLLLA